MQFIEMETIVLALEMLMRMFIKIVIFKGLHSLQRFFHNPSIVHIH